MSSQVSRQGKAKNFAAVFLLTSVFLCFGLLSTHLRSLSAPFSISSNLSLDQQQKVQSSSPFFTEFFDHLLSHQNARSLSWSDLKLLLWSPLFLQCRQNLLQQTSTFPQEKMLLTASWGSCYQVSTLFSSFEAQPLTVRIPSIAIFWLELIFPSFINVLSWEVSWKARFRTF